MLVKIFNLSHWDHQCICILFLLSFYVHLTWSLLHDLMSCSWLAASQGVKWWLVFCRMHLKHVQMLKPTDLKQHIRLDVLLQSCTGHPARIKIKWELPRGGNVVTNGVCVSFQIHGEVLLNSCNPHLCTVVCHAKIVGFSQLIRVSWGAYWFYNISVSLPRQKRAESFKHFSN